MTSISPCSPPVVTRDAKAYYNALTALLAKSDGRDKFLAAIQFVAMYGAAGQAGHLSNIAKNLGGARKPFRVLKVSRCVNVRTQFRKPGSPRHLA